MKEHKPKRGLLILLNLPIPIENYIRASNAHNTQALLPTLTSDAIIIDESQPYHGHSEIEKWNEKTIQDYHAVFEVLESQVLVMSWL